MQRPRCLPVPLFSQPATTPYCGHTCAKMILAYHGIDMPLRDIVREAGTTKCGIVPVPLGSFFLRQGFGVTIVGFDPHFPPHFARLPADRARRALADWRRRASYRDTADYRRYLPEFWSLGGVYLPRPVSPTDIREALRRHEPCILNLNVSVLRSLREKEAGHYVVPISFGEQTVVLNDPSGKPRGRLEYPIHEILHASYTWRSTAIFVSPEGR